MDVIHYHGTPITPRTVLHTLAGRSFCVPYPEPRDLEIAHEIGEGCMLDNGAFSLWTKGKATDWPGYYAWCEPWLDYPTTWAVIPDVIEAGPEANDALLAEWPHGDKGAPVWHLDEPIDRLLSLAQRFPRVCMGSSGAGYRVIGSDTWTRRMDEAFNALCGNGPVPVWVHMLRGLDLCGGQWPFASADSTNVARNHAGAIGRRPRSALTMAEEIDARQCGARWNVKHHQEAMDFAA